MIINPLILKNVNMKKKTQYLIGVILAIVMSVFGAGLFMYAYPCTRVNGVILVIYSFTTACVALLFYEQYTIEKKEDKK